MSRTTFVNLPVKDLAATVAFWTGLGFEFNPAFTDDRAACMVISDEAYVMLLTEPFFRTFTTREPCDTSRGTEGLFALSAQQQRRSERDGESRCRRRRHARDGSPGSRIHVRLELLRRRRTPLGGVVDG
ncbi:MAG: VOC family protein, partial [Nocardioidaceae bacterium]